MAKSIYPLLKAGLDIGTRTDRVVKVDVHEDAILPGLWALYVEDVGESFQWIMEQRRHELGLEIAEMRRVGLENMTQKIELSAKIEDIDPDVISITGLETLESSALLVPNAVHKFGFEMARHVVAIPSREYFLFCNRSDPHACNRLETIALEIYDNARESRKLTTRLIEFDENQRLRYA